MAAPSLLSRIRTLWTYLIAPIIKAATRLAGVHELRCLLTSRVEDEFLLVAAGQRAGALLGADRAHVEFPHHAQRVFPQRFFLNQTAPDVLRVVLVAEQKFSCRERAKAAPASTVGRDIGKAELAPHPQRELLQVRLLEEDAPALCAGQAHDDLFSCCLPFPSTPAMRRSPDVHLEGHRGLRVLQQADVLHAEDDVPLRARGLLYFKDDVVADH